MKQVMKRAGAGTPSAEPHHAAARPRRRRHRRDARGVPREPALAVRHGAGRQRPLRRRHRRRRALPVRRRRDPHRRRADEGRGLPAGPINHHWTKNVIASADGAKLYVTVGSNSNVGENGMAAEEGRAAIWEIDAQERQRPHLRHRPAQPERHGLGQRRHALDGRQRARRDRQRPRARLPHLGARRRVLRLALQLLRPARRRPRPAAATRPRREGDRARLRARPAHRLARPRRVGGTTLPAPFSGEGMFVGQHGSWNRRPRSGYKVDLRAVRQRQAVGRADRRADRLPQRRRRRRADRSAWRSTRAARCWSPTTSATSSGASPPPAADAGASARAPRASRYFLLCAQSLSAASVFSTWRLGFRLW